MVGMLGTRKDEVAESHFRRATRTSSKKMIEQLLMRSSGGNDGLVRDSSLLGTTRVMTAMLLELVNDDSTCLSMLYIRSDAILALSFYRCPRTMKFKRSHSDNIEVKQDRLTMFRGKVLASAPGFLYCRNA